MNSTNSLTPDFSSLGLTVKSDAERYPLISWCLIAVLGSLIGNTTILLSTIRYNAIRLDKISVLLINNIAVSDIAMAVFAVHPTLVSLIYNRWPYGDTMCYVHHFLQVPTYLSAVYLICALHLSKLHNLLYPFQSMSRTRRSAYLISAGTWLLSAVTPLVQIATDRRDVTFDYRIYRCKYGFRAPVWQWLLAPLSTVVTVLPNVIVVGTTIALLVIIKKAKGRTNKQGAITALYIGCVYLLANSPVAFYTAIYMKISHLMSPGARLFFDVNVYGFSYFVMFINCFTNGFVYYRSVNSFKMFVKRVALAGVSRMSFRQIVKPFVNVNIQLQSLNRPTNV